MSTPSRTDRLCAYLQRTPYFVGIEAGILHEVAGLATWHEYDPGAVIFLEGELNTGLYTLDVGWVKVVKFSLDGREQVLRYFGPGQVFSEIGIFMARPNPVTAIALEHVALWRLHHSTLRPLWIAQPELLLHVLANMADRISHLADLAATLSLHPVEVRLARLLLEAGVDNTLPRQSWLTQAELAARLGTVPDVLSRALRTLSDAGLIRVDRRQITILNREALLQRAQVV